MQTPGLPPFGGAAAVSGMESPRGHGQQTAKMPGDGQPSAAKPDTKPPKDHAWGPRTERRPIFVPEPCG
jgi:hypothetical protein